MKSFGSDLRRFPRRVFEGLVGFLYRGQYYTLNALEIGEKGIGFIAPLEMQLNDGVVINFFIKDGTMIICRAEVRFSMATEYGYRKGFEFVNIKFEDRRLIRDYIAEKNTAIPAGNLRF